jgi:hypothetical protein
MGLRSHTHTSGRARVPGTPEPGLVSGSGLFHWPGSSLQAGQHPNVRPHLSDPAAADVCSGRGGGRTGNPPRCASIPAGGAA